MRLSNVPMLQYYDITIILQLYNTTSLNSNQYSQCEVHTLLWYLIVGKRSMEL
jgi:hypothetical protein